MGLKPENTTHFTAGKGGWRFTPNQKLFLNANKTMTNAELAVRFGASESTIEDFIRSLKAKGILPNVKKIRADDVAAYKEEIQKLKKWAKNPTFENWSKYFGRIASKERGNIQRNIRAYFSGDYIPAGSKRMLDSLEITKQIPKNAQNVLKTFTIDFFRKKRGLLGGTAAAIARTPLQKGINDYAEIIKIFSKYNDQIDISKLDKQDQILRLMKKNPVIIERFKKQGVPLTLKNLRTRVARTHNALINNSLNSKLYPGIFEGLSLADRQQFLNKAMRTFDNTIFRSFQGQLVDRLKGNELKLANDKLSKFTNLKQFLSKKLKHTGGLHGSLIELDHPISLAALEKSKNLHQSLRVTPIPADINKWKLTLDRRLNVLQEKRDVKGLRALNEINQVLFGKRAPSFTVGAKGISQIKGLPADFRKANLLALLRENVGLYDTLKQNIKNIPKETWTASGVNQAAVTERLNQLKSLKPEVLTRYIDQWTKENPKWTKIIEKRIGCKTGCLAAAANENPARFSEILKNTPQAARSFLGFLGKIGPKVGKYGAIAAAGAVAQPLIKQFMNDDPSTYLTDPDQQAGMLEALIEGERPKPRSEILDWSLGGAELGATAAAIPGSGALYKFRRGLSEAKIPKAGPVSEAGLTAGDYLSKHAGKNYGKLRAGAGVGLKALSGMFTPAGLLATEPLRIAQKRREGESWGDIATSPMTWMGPAFAPEMTRIATAGMKKGSLLPRLLRLGISRGALAAMGPVGWAGLAASLGWEGYSQYQDYKKGRGFFASDEE
jgi:hypothetical protein